MQVLKQTWSVPDRTKSLVTWSMKLGWTILTLILALMHSGYEILDDLYQ
jgi:hypothetical protein